MTSFVSPDPKPQRPVLRADLDPGQSGSLTITVSPLSVRQQAALARLMEAGSSLLDVLWVSVVEPAASHHDTLPAIAGRHQLVEDGLRFLPYFPPEPGVYYRASFHPEQLGDAASAESLSLQFSVPEPPVRSPVEVERIYPTGDCLPENLLRLYIVFSRPMWRGCAAQHIQLLGPDGEPAPDVLYRSPVELWDRSMRTLTILLDPGRLKRGVGPNRELGPPLAAGQNYTLVVGAGMLDGDGRPLAGPMRKRFGVKEPVRDAIAAEEWQLRKPAERTYEPLVLCFPAPLDWALLTSALTVSTAAGKHIAGHVHIDAAETLWCFTPAEPWAAGSYHVLVDGSLEDVCGNTPSGAFDRPLRQGCDLCIEEMIGQLPFSVGSIAEGRSVPQ